MTTGGTMTGPLLFTTNTRIGMDNAAYGGVPNMCLYSNGGEVVFYAGGWDEWTPPAGRGTNFKVFGNGGSEEYWGVTGGISGLGAALKVYSIIGDYPCTGSILASNGGQLLFGNDYGTVLNVNSGASLTKNYLRITGGGSGVGPQLTAQGETDVGLTIAPKGTGELQASTAGDARGTHSTDWQRLRASNAQVASGANSVISGGNSNTAGGPTSSVGGGYLNNADGNYATIPGGSRAWARGQHGFFGWASGIIEGAQEGDAQGSWRLLRGIATGGAAVRLTSDQLAINTASPNINSVHMGAQRGIAMSVKLVGLDVTNATTTANAYFNEVLWAKNGSGASTIALGTARTLGTALPTVAITVGAEGLLSIVVTPANSNTWHFLAKLSICEER
jgi:hypothetical protein